MKYFVNIKNQMRYHYNPVFVHVFDFDIALLSPPTIQAFTFQFHFAIFSSFNNRIAIHAFFYSLFEFIFHALNHRLAGFTLIRSTLIWSI